MAQTPVSASVEVLQGTTTLYTVPVGKTAVVKAVLGGSVVGQSPSYTVNKVSGGTSYPIVVSQTTSQVNATGGTTINNANLLQAPVTLAAGESITVYTGTSDSLQIPQVASYTNTTPFTFYIAQIIYANSIFMAIGYSGVNSALVITSSDGVTWTKQSLATSDPALQSVTYGNGYWVALPSALSDYVYVSSNNGTSWTAVNVTTSAGIQGTAVAYVNSLWTFVGYGSLYTTTTPATGSWTINTAWSSYNNSNTASGRVTSISHDGTYYYFTGYNMGIIYSSDLSTFTSYGCLGGGYYNQNGRYAVGVSYSSAYSKWYANNRGSAAQNTVYTSTDSVNWTKLTTPSYSDSGPIQIAGSNSILLIQNTSGNVGSSSNSAYMKSTDGTTWAVANDIANRSGPLIGLSNGYFVKFYDSGSRYGISTDPTSSTGTTYASSTSFACTNIGISNGTKWIVYGWNTSNSYLAMTGGSSGTNVNGWYSSANGYDVNGYGYPSAACWNPTNGYFYMITRYGVIFRMTTYSNEFEYITQIGNTTDAQYGIAYMNGFMYVTSARLSTTKDYVYISTDFVNYTAFQVGGTGYNKLVGQKASLSSYAYSANNMGINGTTSLTILNDVGWTYNVSSSSPYTPYYYPQGVIHYQRVNSNNIFYGGVDLGGNTLNGLWAFPSGLTTSPIPISTSVQFAQNSTSWNMNNYIVYTSSKYYAVTNSGAIYSGSTLSTLINLSFSSSSPNGINYVSQAASSIQTNGSNFYYMPVQNISTNGSLSLGVTSNLADSINNSVMTGSIVEIS